MKKNSLLHQPLFRILVPPFYALILYILILLLFSSIEQLKTNFFSIEYLLTILLTYLSLEVMRILTLYTERKIRSQNIQKRLSIHLITNILATTLITTLIVSFYFSKLVGFLSYQTELIIFNILFLITAVLYTFTYFSIFLMNHTNQMLLEKEKQEKEKLQNELENYKSHLSPELLNKSMEYLIGIGHQNKELADDFIHNLSDFYRFTLKKRRDEIIPLNEELAVTEKLMWIMKIVYERNISWETDFSNEEGYIVPNTLTALMQQCIYATIINSFQPLKLHLSCSENHLILWHASNPRLTHNKTHDDIQRIKQVYALYTDKPIIQETLNNKDYYRIPLLTINK